MDHCPVEILLPTYNGGRYITDLLESLCNQTCSAFTLITRDDGSSDDTVERMNAFSSRLNITRIENTDGSNLGVAQSFELLISRSTAELLFFCDQDDIWNPEKIERMMLLYSERKTLYGSGPMLLFSDLSLIDEKGAPAGESFLSTTGVNTACIGDPYYLSFKNPSPGCAMAVNRSLALASFPFLRETFMHDWWMMINASLRGRVEYLDERLVQYRIHSANTLGVTPDRQAGFLSLFGNWLFSSRLLMLQNRNIAQGKAVFRKNGRRFSVLRYVAKVFLGRKIMPKVVRLTGRGIRYSWVAPDKQ